MKQLFLIGSILFTTTVLAKFNNESEVSLMKTGGNSDSATYGLKSKSDYTLDKNLFAFAAAYNFAESNEVTSTENWKFGVKYNRELFTSLGLYLGELVESDRFTGFDKRYNSDLGLFYSFFKSDKTELKAELGYRYTIEEDLIGESENYSKMRLFSEYSLALNENVKFKYWLEYVPNLTESGQYQLSMEPVVEVVLAKELFFKVSYEWKYENTPVAGKSKQDYAFKTSLLATF